MNKRDLKEVRSKTLKGRAYNIYIDINMNKRDLKRVRSKTLEEKIHSIYIDIKKRDLKELTKAQLVILLLNPILPGLLNTLRTWGEGILPPPNSLVFYPRSIKFGM